MALGTIPAATQQHVDEAFTRAILLSLGTAVIVAIVAALSVTWLVSRRIAAPVTDLAAAAERLSLGHTDTRVPDPGLGPEFAALATSFNATAARLARTERVRQRMLADLAHELRTPIGSIEATVEAVADGILPRRPEGLGHPDRPGRAGEPPSSPTSPPCPTPNNGHSTSTCGSTP